jgi:predicted transcriptional regulator
MAKLLDNRDLLQSPVSEVMDRALPVVNEDMSVETAVKYLKSSPALLVEEYGRIVGIVTRQDVLDIQS